MTPARRTEAAPALGRPRSEAARAAILAAAVVVLAERGWEGFAIDVVADRAGVGKTTIYRWWRGRGELAIEAFFEQTKDALRFPETGSAREDFALQIQELGDLFRTALGAAMVGIVQGARSSPELARTLVERWVMPRKQWGVTRLERAIADGQAPHDLDVDAALDLLYGPLYARLLIFPAPPSRAVIDAYLRVAFRAVFTVSRTRGRASGRSPRGSAG